MKSIYIAIIVVLSGFSEAFGQTTIDYAIRVSATVQKSPASIRLSWPAAPSGSVINYFIYRKLKSDPTFPSIKLATLNGTDTAYVDNNVTAGVYYEYELVKTITNAF